MNSVQTNLTLFERIEQSLFMLIFVRSTLSIQFLLSFSLNFYIIIFLLTKVRGADGSVVFELNHAAAEILFSISSLLYFIFMFDLSLFINILLDFFYVSSMSARHLFLCCVCLERYLAVVHPVIFLKFKPLRYRVVCSALAWICALVLGTISCIILSTCKVLLFVSVFVLVVELFCCASILKRLRHPGPRNIEREQGEMSTAKKKAFQIVCVNLLTCSIQNAPIAVSYILEVIVPENHSYMAVDISTTINILAGFVQPVQVLHKAGKLSFIRHF